MPRYILGPIEDYYISKEADPHSLIRVSRQTSLADLLEPNQGTLYLSACTVKDKFLGNILRRLDIDVSPTAVDFTPAPLPPLGAMARGLSYLDKGLAVVGTTAAVANASSHIYRDYIDGGPYHLTAARETAGLAGAAIGANIGRTLGIAAGGLCGPGVEVCSLGGAIVFGGVGGAIGGVVGKKLFDIWFDMANS